MHFCARVIERRNAEKNIVLCLRMVILLNHAGMDKCPVGMKNGFREARCSRREIYCRIIVIRQLNAGIS